jgi:hypothetical protein
VGKKFGQFEQNLAKSGQSLEKVSQPKGLRLTIYAPIESPCRV